MITLIFSIQPKPLLALFPVLSDMCLKHISCSRALVKATGTAKEGKQEIEKCLKSTGEAIPTDLPFSDLPSSRSPSPHIE